MVLGVMIHHSVDMDIYEEIPLERHNFQELIIPVEKHNFLETNNQWKRLSPRHVEVEEFTQTMQNIQQQSTCPNFETVCQELISMIQDPSRWQNFSTELKEISRLRGNFQHFSIIYILRTSNSKADSLAKIAKSLHRELCYFWLFCSTRLSRPPQDSKSTIYYEFFSLMKKVALAKIHTNI